MQPNKGTGLGCATFLAVLLLAAAAFPQTLVRTEVPAPADQLNHAPGLIELASGALLLCWYSATAEAHADARILCARSEDAGAHWSPPRLAVPPEDRARNAPAPNKSLGNVVLHRDSRGRLWMIHGVIQRWDVPPLGNLCRNWLCGRVDARLSTDGGATWSAAWRLDDSTGALPRNRVLRHPTLGDLLPLYREGARTAHLLPLDLAGDTPSPGPPLPIPAEDAVQPALVLQPDGRIRAYLRDLAATAIRTTLLDPATRAWTAPVPTTLPNPNAAIEAFLAWDRIVLLHNPSHWNRRALRFASSSDGVHFTPGCDLVPDSAEGDVAYPIAIRATDGTYHIAYSAAGKRRIRHARFDAAWLAHCLAP